MHSAKDTYDEDSLPEFTPMNWSLKEIRNAIPARLFVRNTTLGLMYTARDLTMATTLWYGATYIDLTFRGTCTRSLFTSAGAEVMRWAVWMTYWWFQGLTFTGLWVIGHECGHGALSSSRTLCDVVGYFLHTVLWTPYFSWRISHHRHHSNHASMEKDEVYIPKTRSELGIPQEGNDPIDYEEFFGDTPIYTLFMLIRQQLLAFPAYLLFNVSGQKNYPKGTNHFDPKSILFNPAQRNAVILSNIGIFFMAWLVTLGSSIHGTANVMKYYGIPWLAVTHWFIMITYLHHTDPQLPHFRKGEWSFQRGAACTVDRDFLGWQGRFFLHDVAHYHVVHHFFPQMPFYHGAEATGYLRALIGEHYTYSNAPLFKTLWENYNSCQFVEDQGDIVFYKDRRGQARRRPTAQYRLHVNAK
ncbi:linoleoyl phosphatidylcholine delta-12 acetylenase [Hysterangium stoloniferum]|nr:linoleoyl phosphatidylcholine delta-12 acetylenase [Hysterangium stoloniferum]